jgi:hypothetical protein
MEIRAVMEIRAAVLSYRAHSPVGQDSDLECVPLCYLAGLLAR